MWSFYRDHELGVLRHIVQQLLFHTLLYEILITVTRLLLLQSGGMNGKVLDLLTRVEGAVFLVPTKPVQSCLTDTVDVDVRCSDGVPRFLGRDLVGERGSDL